MTEDPASERIVVVWSPEARADRRAIERETAMQILHCIDRYLASRTGDNSLTSEAGHTFLTQNPLNLLSNFHPAPREMSRRPS